MRVFVGGIETETNTFSPMPTGLADFTIIRDLTGLSESDGFIGPVEIFRKRALERGWEFIFSLQAFAQPAGITVCSTYETMRDEILDALQEAMPVDVVLLPLHGSMVAEGYDDCETDLIQRVREIVGNDTKIGVELDLHCDITQEMVDASTAIMIYKEYPHIDMNEIADQLFTVIADAAEGNTNPVMQLYDCRMIGLYPTPNEPMRSYVDEMALAEQRDGVIAVSLAHCFPWADIPSGGAQALVVADGNEELAEQVAEEFGKKLFKMRHELDLNSLSLTEAFNQAEAETAYPVVVADQSDNAGGGAPSDSTFALQELLNRGITNVAIGMVWDPIVVQVAMAAGEGATLDIRLGGKMGTMSGDPLDLTVTVTKIVPNMVQHWPQKEGALKISCGDSVALHCQGIDIVVNSKRTQVFSPDVFSNMDINPQEKRILVVKSMQHFYAGFAPIASKIIYMASPGSVVPIFKDIPYKRVDLNKYPWIDNPFE
jgi:microcystin degradation protein MlrC